MSASSEVFDLVDEEMEKEAGFRLSMPLSWNEQGIHPTGAFRFSALGFGSWGLPDPALLSFDTRDQDKLLAYLARQVGGEWSLEAGKPEVYQARGVQTAVGFLGGRMYLYGGSAAGGGAATGGKTGAGMLGPVV